MTFDFRYPNITGATEKEQLQQMKTYVHQLVDQLKWALNSVDSSQGNYNVVTGRSTTNTNSGIATVGVDGDTVQTTFDELKPLIIKSAEIVDAYYEEINRRLEGLYVAQSDFGTYIEQTSQNIQQNSTDITQMFTNVQTIAADVETLDTNLADVDKSVQSVDKNLWELDGKLDDAKEGIDSSLGALSTDLGKLDSGINEIKEAVDGELQGIKDEIEAIAYSIIEVNASIKSGLLYYDENEVPIYGLEVGQRNIIDGVEVFRKYARFTANRLSFYDQNDIEVAYISDYKLHITNAEITNTLKLGAFLVDTSKGFRLKYVGRG